MGAVANPERFQEEPTKAPPSPRGVGFIPAREAAHRSGIPIETVVRWCRDKWVAMGLAELMKPSEGGKPCWHVREDADRRFGRGGGPDLIPFDWGKLTEKQRQAVRRRKRLIDQWYLYREKAMGSGCSERGATERFVESLGIDGERPVPSRETLFRWARSYQHGGFAGLVDKRLERSGGREGEKFTDELKRLYLNPRRRTVAFCYAMAAEKAEEEGWVIPYGQERARQLINAIPKKVRDFHREGQRAYDANCGRYILRDYEQLESNEVWISDGHDLNVFVEHNGKLVRPTLVGWFDAASRMYVGWMMTAGSENSDGIMLAFKRGVEALGLPRVVYYDNGRAYRSRVLEGGDARIERHRGMFERLGVRVIHSLPYNAKAKTVERFHRTLDERFSRLFDTYCGGDTSRKPDNLEQMKARGHATTLAELRDAFADWLEADYHHRDHEGQGMSGRTPAEVYAQKLVQKREVPQSVLDLELCRHEVAKVGRVGVRINYTIYEAPELHALGGREVTVLTDDDLTRVIVLDDEGRMLCVAKAVRRMPFLADREELRESQAEVRRERRKVKQAQAVEMHIADDPIGRLHRKAERNRAAAPVPKPASVTVFKSKLGDQAEEIRRELERARQDQAAEDRRRARLLEELVDADEASGDGGDGAKRGGAGPRLTLADLFGDDTDGQGRAEAG